MTHLGFMTAGSGDRRHSERRRLRSARSAEVSCEWSGNYGCPSWRSEGIAGDIDGVYAILDRPAGSDGVKSITLGELHFIMRTNARMLDARSAAVGGYRNLPPLEFAKVLWGKEAPGDSFFYGHDSLGGYGGTSFRISGAPGGLSRVQIGGDINYYYQGMLHAARGNSFSTAHNSVVTYNLAFKNFDRIPDRLRWTAYGYDFYNRLRK